MAPIQVRPFQRQDRQQLTALVNAHAAAVVPGMTVSVSTILSQLERQPGEFIVDPWVSERTTLVAAQAGRVVAAAHLLRYFDDDRAGQEYRDTGEIAWLVFWPEAPEQNPYWPDAAEAATRLMAASIGQLERWGVSRQHADGALPVPGVYGLPEQWPHVRRLYEQAGFAHTGHAEIVYLARVSDLPRPAGPPVPGLQVRRTLGINGTRLSAVAADEVAGYIEVETLESAELIGRHGAWADIGNLHVAEPYRRRGIGTWLLGQAAGWLALGQVERVLDYAWAGDAQAGHDYGAYREFLAAAGFTELTRTTRSWVRR